MGLYTDLDDVALKAKIVELRTAYETTIGGQVAVVAGNGRRMEYTRADSSRLLSLLRDAQNELAERSGTCPTSAIGVCF